MSSESVIVQALFSFKGTNNDELCFKKGDKITITQKEEGGWWEGTLGDKTGWFPTNYVKEIKEVVSPALSPVAQQRQYRAVVLKDLIDSEKAHIAELQGLVNTFLKPLEKSSKLTTDEYRQLTGNIIEVLETHQQLLELIEECESKPSNEQRVGKLFLTWAPKIKAVHQAYCSTHPRAVCILDIHKDELATFMESCGAATPGLLVLTTGLSKPFRRLDKYSGMLQELERHVEINHPDRGDTQRSVAVYKDIAATCAATRRQKELELQVLTGPVRGWEGQSLAQLGDILHMGSVAVGPQHQDRYFVLFPNTLLVLSVSQRMSAFIYEGKLPLTGITVIKLEEVENHKNAFEISGPMIEKIVAICQSKEEANNWVDLLRQHTKGYHKTPPPVTIPDTAPTPPPHLDRRGYSVRTSVLTYTYTPPKPYKVTLPPWFYPPASPYSTLTKSFYRLVKERVITHRLLKKLLYPEYSNITKMDLSQVPVRKHKTECYIQTGSGYSDDSGSSDSDSNSDSDGNDDRHVHLCRQNAVIRDDDSDSASDKHSDETGSTNSNPFGFIRYYNPRNNDSTEAESYASFIDYGESIQQPKIIEISAECNQTMVQESSDRLKLGAMQQISQESGGSSFDCGPARPYMACEDLLNIDESIEIETLGSRQFVPKSHQSLPSKFVANKFNKSSLTMVYIPQWQSNSESNLASRSETNSKTDLDSKSNYSSRDDVSKSKSCSRSDASRSKTNSATSKFSSSNNESRNKSTLTIDICRSKTTSRTDDSNAPRSKSNSRTSNDFSSKYSSRENICGSKSSSRSDITRSKTVSRSDSFTSRSRTRSRTDSESSGETTTHSSCLDLAVNPLPVPDSIVAEILYNPELEAGSSLWKSVSVESDQTEMSNKTVIKPPVMFRNQSDTDSISPILHIRTSSLSRKSKDESKLVPVSENVEEQASNISIERKLSLRMSNVSFKQHCFNSDKPKRRSSSQEHNYEPPKEPESSTSTAASQPIKLVSRKRGLEPQRRSSIQENKPVWLRRDRNTNSLRKCVSYHYLQLANPQSSNYGQFCRGCTEPCYSRRSSDSGMAGSCTLHSPDLPIGNDNTESLLYSNREHYSMTDIPDMYDSINTNIQDMISLSEMEARDFEAQCRCTSPFGSTPRTSCQASTSENILVGARDSTTSVTSSSSDMSPFPTPHPWESENQIYEKLMSMKDEQHHHPDKKMSPLAITPAANRPNQSIANNRSGVSPNLTSLNNNGGWSATCLRPSPPLRPCLALGSVSQGSPLRSNRKTLSHNDDAQILKVIEAYCNSTRPKNTISTGDTDSHEDRKTTDNQAENILVENVKSLQNEVRDLQRSIGVLMVQLTEEKIARCALQNIVRAHLVTNKETDSIQWPQSDI